MTWTDRLWSAVATFWIVACPLLWWKGLSQDVAQGIAWHLSTVILFAVSALCVPRRPLLHREALAIGLIACVLSSCFHPLPNGYSSLVLHSWIAVLGVGCLTVYAPSSRWIIQRLQWMALCCVGYWGLQMVGIDPLFYTTDTSISLLPKSGLFARSNALAVMCAVLYPMSPWWMQGILLVVLIASGHLMSLLLVGGYAVWYALRRNVRGWASFGIVMAGMAWWGWTSPVFTTKVLPRLFLWKSLLDQAVWSPLIGYGWGAWPQMSPHPNEPWSYSMYLLVWHDGGILLLIPLLWLLYRILHEPSTYRASLVLLSFAALTHDLWMMPRLVMVTTALLSAHWVAITEEERCEFQTLKECTSAILTSDGRRKPWNGESTVSTGITGGNAS